MNIYFQSIILGIVQGLTEFLPVSSSGHLVLVKNFFDINTEGALFEVVLHLGTTLAILIYFYKKLLNLDMKLIKAIVIATIPAALVGILLKDPIEALFTSTKIVGVALLVTAFINFMIDRYTGRKESVDSIDASFIGIAQAFAIIPGISRSGSTILMAKFLKIDSKSAAEFSFLMSVPAIVGANILQFVSHGIPEDQYGLGFYLVGFLAAFISGIFAIDIMIKLLTAKRLKYFSLYLVVIGLFAIFLA